MINNGMSWLSLGNYINPKARNTELSNDYNQLTNRPIITLTGTSQNPIKLWKLDVGLYILNGYVQHTDALLSEARGLFVSATVGIVDGKYVMSAFIPFWEGQYEYILPSLSSETYTEHQMIRMITQGNSLTLDNIREYTPSEEYHPSTKKYVDDTIEIMRNELGKMGLNNNDIQSLMKENRRRDIAIQALLSQNSDKMVTINEEVHNISMDYSLDNGIATINTLEGDTLVNVSKDTEYDKVLSYEQDIVENTNTVDLEVDGNLNPIIVGDTLVNVCTQNNPTAITNEYTVEGSNHFALQDVAEGNCRPIIQGNTIVNRSKTKDITPLTTYVSEVEGNEMSLVDDTDTHVRVDKLVGDTMVSPMGSCYGTSTKGIYYLKNGRIQNLITENGNYYIKKENGELCKTKPNTIYTVILDGTIECNNKASVSLFYRVDNKTTKTISTFHIENNPYVNKIVTFTSENEDAFGFYFSDYDKITNIDIKYMILEGDYTNKPIPQEYFEGLKNSYEDGYIPNNIWTDNNILPFTVTSDGSNQTVLSDVNITTELGKTYTVILDISDISGNGEELYVNIAGNSEQLNQVFFKPIEGINIVKLTYNVLSDLEIKNVHKLKIYHLTKHNSTCIINSVILLEGDYTSNPPTYEEVMEHSGQYRCEVEVQGKNLFDGKLLKSTNSNDAHITVTDNGNGSYSAIGDGTEGRGFVGYFNAKVKPNTKYMFNYKINGEYSTESYFIYVYKGRDKIWSQNSDDILTSVKTVQPITIPNNVTEITIGVHYMDFSESCTISDIQLEEGDTATAYEPYYNQTQTVYLNSPLLKGDEVVYKESKLCHYHKMGKVVLDGSENFTYIVGGTKSDTTAVFIRVTPIGTDMGIAWSNTSIKYCDTLSYNWIVGNQNNFTLGYYPVGKSESVSQSHIRIRLTLDDTVDSVKQWLSENPTTVVYELANPYYETISTSELLLPITTNCKLLTSSNIPLTTMSTRVFTEEVNILANTQYSLNFNSNIASTVNITLGGTVLSNQAIVQGYNKLSITTPSTLVDNLLIIEGSGVNISEVVVTEYDEGVCEYIEGLKSSFEDGWIPSEEDNLAIIKPIDEDMITSWYNITAKLCPLNKIKPNTEYTLIYNLEILSTNSTAYRSMDLTTGKTSASGNSQYFDCKNGLNIIKFKYGEKPFNEEHQYIFIRPLRRNTAPVEGEYVTYKASDFYLFEGDWTHLTEEDLNHLGQYKVEYKTVGKNLFNGIWEAGSISNSGNPFNVEKRIRSVSYIKVKPNTSYIRKSHEIYVITYDKDKNFLERLYYAGTNKTFVTAFNVEYIKLVVINTDNLNLEYQLEEGTVATEYEPYKESIQTVYLNSPLLKGDTIEEIDGEVYHVHRYKQLILNGYEQTGVGNIREGWFMSTTGYVNNNHFILYLTDKTVGFFITDKANFEGIAYYWRYNVIYNDKNNTFPNVYVFKQWLQQNPTTVVYKLENPTYELIPSSSIVCKSYPNGHLDFNTNVHINNTVNFVKANLPITYANTSTNYKLQFVSDKDMENVTINALGNIMENVTINKGLNKISFTSPSDATNILTFEGLGYAYISNVQLVATDKDIDYFKGLYSTYECGLIEDESNENYGKYEVNIVSYNAPIQFGKGGKIE